MLDLFPTVFVPRSIPDATPYFFIFNMKKKPLNNEKIRRAFSLAIDRKAIVEK
ncbi:ABC transporter substrate-binding protein, partial [Paenactinomyces guangxiensis]|uniref:ABC transporter substrate-binding protein n=1 Tax=Paenactinomyces guangxiensis TaxID=1490290 RepID=UPI0035A82957